MKFSKNWKRIIAGFMAATMVFLSIDGGCLTALAAEIQELNNEKGIVADYPTGGLLPLKGVEGSLSDSNNHVIFEPQYNNGEVSAQEVYDWSKHASYLIYNQLSPEWKTIWDEMDALCLKYLTTNVDGYEVYNYFDEEYYYFTEDLEISHDITSNDFGTLFYLFMSSNPQYYFLGYSGYQYIYGNDGDDYIDYASLGIYKAFLDGDMRLETTEAFLNVIKEAYNSVSISDSESTKLKSMHDYIVNNVEYNYEILKGDNGITNAEEAEAFTQSAYSALCMDYTVCAGYAEALQLLCNGLNVDSMSVTSIDHQWNKVRINDSWYNVDPTWADNGKTDGANNPIYYGYYGRSDAFYKNDTNPNASSHIEETLWDAYIPECVKDTNPTESYVPGDFYVPTVTLPTPVITAKMNSEHKYDVTITWEDEEGVYNEAIIYYTLDETEPSIASTKSEIYRDAFTVDADTVIKAVAVFDGYYDSEIAVLKAVSTIENVANKSHFYQKQTFVWKAMSETADGYIIKVYNSADSTQIGEEIDITNANTNFYLYDTSALSEGTSIYYEIYGYAFDENEHKVAVTEPTVSGKTIVNQLSEPLDVVVKWHVTTSDGANLLVVNVEENTQDKLSLWYFTDKNGINSLNNFTLDMTDGVTEFKYSLLNHGVAYDEVGYVLITDAGKTTAFQDNGFAVGGEYKAPVLKPIEDIQLESTGDTVVLKAQIEDESLMKNFNYKYQWYVAEDATSEGTPIDGATADEYEVQIGSFDEKFYYCEVTAEYLTKHVYQTKNASEKHTCVQGALYNTNITPDRIENQVYDGLAKEPALTLRNELNKVLVLDTDYTIQYLNNINAGEATIKVDFIGAYDALEDAIINFNILPKQASKDTLEFTDVVTGKEYIYNGTPFTPTMEVKDIDRNVLLVPDGDYDIAYNANIDKGTATITLKFKGNYQGRVVIDFEIKAKSAENVTIDSIADQTFTGQAIVPDLTIKDGDKVLVVDKDYKVTCVKNIHVATADVTIEFIGNYYGTKTTKFDIVPRDAAEVLITTIAKQEYTGFEIEPSLEVMYRNENGYPMVLTKGTNYTVEYSNNIELGTATVTLKFDGDFKGTRTETFEIVPKNAENLTYFDFKAYIYDGTEHKPPVVVMNGELTLVEGVDYIVEYVDNINAGTGKAIVKFEGFEGCSGNYAGTKELTFQIAPKFATDCIVTLETLENYTFTGTEYKPGVTVMDGEIQLVEQTEEMEETEGDYTVTYSNNINAGEATVTITFINNYTGESSQTFVIERKPITEADIEIEAIADQTYIGKTIIPENIVVKDKVSGVTLRPDEDYTVAAGAENTYVGTGTVIISLDLEGNYIYTGEPIEANFNIVPRDASNVTISPIPEQKYTGQEITPELEVKDGDIVLIAGVDYTVTYENNIEVGAEATVTISFKGNFKGEDKTATFTIIDPVPTSITSSVFTVNQSNGYISKITVGTTKYTLWSAFNEKDYVEIYDKSGAIVSNDKVLVTGMTAGIIDEGTVTKRYTIVVTGDTNGDGKINITDMIAVKACTLKKSGLSGAYEKAGDVNGDGKINITDFIKVKATTLKKDTIVGVSVN